MYVNFRRLSFITAFIIVTIFLFKKNTTQSAASADPVIEAAGDIVCSTLGAQTATACRHMAVSQLVENNLPTAVLAIGDLCHTPTADCFNSYYNPSWGRFKNITYPIPGNHEYLTAGASTYFDYWNGVGNQTGPAGNRSQGYYSFNIGNWHLIALNSQCSEVGGCGQGSPQESWLQTDLQTHSNQCTLAYWHIPLFSEGGRASSNMETIWNDLYKVHADIVLNGHDHIYERFNPQGLSTGVNSAPADSNGIRSFVVGTGGADHTTIVTSDSNSVVVNNDTFGVLKLTLHSASYDWQFIPDLGGKGTFTDSGTGLCNYSKFTSSPTPSSPPVFLKGDINKDHVVNVQDYILLSNAFGTSNAAADINSDGTVNVQDYIILSNNFGKGN